MLAVCGQRVFKTTPQVYTRVESLAITSAEVVVRERYETRRGKKRMKTRDDLVTRVS